MEPSIQPVASVGVALLGSDLLTRNLVVVLSHLWLLSVNEYGRPERTPVVCCETSLRLVYLELGTNTMLHT